MDKKKHIFELRIIKLLNVVFITIPFVACWFFHYQKAIADSYNKLQSWLIIGLFMLMYIVFARIYDVFLVSLYRISEMIYSQCLATILTDIIIFVVIWLLTNSFPNPIAMLIAFASQCVLATVWSYTAHKWYYFVFPPKKSAIIYDKRKDIERLIHEYGLSKKFDVQLTIKSQDCVNNLTLLDNMEAVFICGVQSHQRNTILKHCTSKGIVTYMLPRIGDVIMSGAMRINMFHLPMLRVEQRVAHPEYTIFKRLFDIVSSASMLLITSPIMIATAIAIKATDGGPVFYKQNRLTKDGKVFKVLKFRSMKTDAEKDGIARLSTGEHDKRITPVGKVIRKYRIDEIPQLFNVLSGDMSIVGPRPERPEIAKQYEEEIPEFKLRLLCKAGLTGYAQVYGKYNTTPYDKLLMDLIYISKPSLLEDFRILIATVKILFVPESTDGIKQGQTTASDAVIENKKELVTASNKTTSAEYDNFDI